MRKAKLYHDAWIYDNCGLYPWQQGHILSSAAHVTSKQLTTHTNALQEWCAPLAARPHRVVIQALAETHHVSLKCGATRVCLVFIRDVAGTARTSGSKPRYSSCRAPARAAAAASARRRVRASSERVAISTCHASGPAQSREWQPWQQGTAFGVASSECMAISTCFALASLNSGADNHTRRHQECLHTPSYEQPPCIGLLTPDSDTRATRPGSANASLAIDNPC